MVVGPGLIVMVADNDAGAVSTYVQAGAQYGTTLLWVLLLLWPTITRGERLTQKIFGAVRLDNAGFIYLHQEDYFQ
jgi:Mn2+/Fe2+ NRAMP family transporter